MNRKLLFSLITGLLVNFAVRAQATFTVSIPGTNCTPVDVFFQDNTPGAVTGWAWDFGSPDALPQTSVIQNPLVKYFKAGTFTVTLTVTFSNLTTSTTTRSVTIKPSPIVDFIASDSVGCFPFPVQFTNLSTSGGAGASMASYLWDLGTDIKTDKDPSLIYYTPSMTTISLVVTNDNGCTGSLTKPQYIKVSTGITADFSISSSSSCKPPTIVNVTNMTNVLGNMTYDWDFGDGTPHSNVMNPPPHTYTTSGNFSIILTASSDAGCTSVKSRPVNVSSAAVSSAMTVPDSTCVGSTTIFLNATTPQPGSATWRFGDGNSATGNRAQYAYPSLGTYTVSLINNFGTCSDSITKQIKVLNAPVANFVALTGTASCKPPLTVKFQSTSTDASTFDWDFGDGSPHGSGLSPSHTYTTYGSFYVTLTAYNGVSCYGSFTKTGFVQILAPTIHITNLPAYGCAPLSFTPTISDTVVDGIATYAWDFGNGNTFNGPNPPAQIYNAGKYVVTLTITSNGGCTATTKDTVKAGTIKPVADFSAVPTTVCVGDKITFKDLSTGGADEWKWEFGDGSISTQENELYAYTRPGTYTVKLTAYNHGCFDVMTKTNLITVNPPLSKFVYKVLCSDKTLYTFTDSSIGATTWDWDFGDGSPHFMGQTPPPHTYPNIIKSYLVTLKVGGSGCTNSSSQVMDVLAKTDFTISVPSACKNTNVFITVVSNPKNAGFIYDFGDGYKSALVSSQSWGHAYANPGKYTLTLIAVDTAGCSDTLSKANAVQINGPVAAFDQSDTISCTPKSVTFTDQSISDGINPITTWFWNFGDGQVSTQKSPVHSFTTQGSYTIGVKITDASGCSDLLFKNNRVIISGLTASFSSIDSSCPGSNIDFVNTSLFGFIPTYTWDFGNATGYVGNGNPSIAYSGIGNYQVTLKAVDIYNCTATATKIITIDTPVASFTMSDSLVKCPPALIDFKFTGKYADSLTWLDGAGGVDNLNHTSIQKIYNLPGDFYPTLLIKSPGGCIARATKHILVQGPKVIPSLSPRGGCDTLTVFFNLTTFGNILDYTWNFGDGSPTVKTLVPSTSHFYTAPSDFKATYLPFVTVTNDSACTVTYIIDTVTVVAIKASFTANKTNICENDSIQFSDQTLTNAKITNYFWDFGDGVSLNTTNPNPAHLYPTPGQYTVKMVVTTQFGCTDADSIIVRIAANPQIDIGGVTSQCVPAMLNYTGIVLVPDTSALSWKWDFDNGQTSNLQNPVTQAYPKAGHYVVRATAINSTGCVDSAAADLYVYPLPGVYAGPDTTICLGQSILLQATGAASYSWLPPSNSSLSCSACQNALATPSVTTTYFVQGTSSLGCTAIDTINIHVNLPVTVTISPDDSVCIGQNVQLTASGADLYAWTPAAGLSSATIANPIAAPTVTTNYQVIGSDNLYCFSDTQYVKISVFNYPTINAGPDATINVGSSFQIVGTGSPDIVSLNWLPVTGLSCTDCLSPLINTNNSTTYIVKAVNDGNCASSDSMRLTVICTGANFFVPNTFSPNGDGANDVFYVRGKGLNIIPSITIFNRWGQIVFQKRDFAPNDPSAGWDGTINGQKAPIDVYVYTVNIICDNSSLIPYHGNITLIR